MRRHPLSSVLPFALFLVPLLLAFPGAARCARGMEVVTLSPSLGPEIDPTERERYGLFPDVEGFLAARVLRDGGSLRMEIRRRDGSEVATSRHGLSEQALETTRHHVAVVEARRAWEARTGMLAESARDEDWYRLGLVLAYGARDRPDIALTLLRDLARAPSARAHDPVALDQLQAHLRALSVPGPALHRGAGSRADEGRVDLMVYAGFWGVWAAIAAPAALDADDPKHYAAALMTVPIGAVLAVDAWARGHDLGEGRAAMMTLGSNLGIWQAYGWSAVGDTDFDEASGLAVVASLVGLTASGVLTRGDGITEGHGHLTNSALGWGIWYGSVLGSFLDEDDGASEDEHVVLKSSLITSAAAVAVTAVASHGSRLSEGDVRLLDLAGVVGGLFGLGGAIVTEIDDGDAALALLAGATAMGKLIAWRRITGSGAGGGQEADDTADATAAGRIETVATRSSGRSIDARLGFAPVPDRTQPGHTLAALTLSGRF